MRNSNTADATATRKRLILVRMTAEQIQAERLTATKRRAKGGRRNTGGHNGRL